MTETIKDRIMSKCRVISVTDNGIVASCGSGFDTSLPDSKVKTFKHEDIETPATGENIKSLIKKYRLG